MPITFLDEGARLESARGQVVVCIPVYGGHDLFTACLNSVLTHTAPGVPILICDDASPDRRSERYVAEEAAAGRLEHHVYYLNQPQNRGFPENVNCGFAVAAPADVVILNSDCEVAAGWLDGLRAAATSDSTVATATTLTNHGTLVSIPGRGAPGDLPIGWNVRRAAAAVAGASQRLRPRLPTAIGHCVYVRRSALELVGAFDPAFTPGYGEEVDFSQRCLRAGLCHVVADDVFVLHHGNASFAATGRVNELQIAHEKIVRARYPYYERSVIGLERERGQLARALGVARRALGRTSVLIDGRVLAGATTGTQVHLVELIAAVSASPGVAEPVGGLELTVLVPDLLSDYGRRALSALEIAQITRSEAEQLTEPFDLVHRPFQVNNLDDMALLGRLGDRLAVTQQDLIGFHNPSYFPDFVEWEGYRQITRRALAVADSVLFFSQHACDQALAENLLEPGRARVVHIGVDHVLGGAEIAPVPPAQATEIPPSAQVILCVGTDFQHKNRVFALRLLEALRRRDGSDPWLVFLGPPVSDGSSRPEEARLLAAHPGLVEAVLDVGAVTDAEKHWLYERANLVLYPTVHEGFGLVPFEAADYGRPCLWAAGTALSEVLDDADAGLIAWDVEQSATAASALLAGGAAAAANVAAIRRAGDRLAWASTGERLARAYHEICDSAGNPTAAAGFGSPTGPLAISEDAMNLISALPPDIERPLLALATHRAVAVPIFALLRWGYRLGFNVARRLR